MRISSLARFSRLGRWGAPPDQDPALRVGKDAQGILRAPWVDAELGQADA
jgi:hypothetical protein